MVEHLPLSQLAPGRWAEVTQMLGPPEQVHRLEEMGIRRGSRVEMVAAGSPCIVRVLGSKLCFRDNQLLSVLVRPEVV